MTFAGSIFLIVGLLIAIWQWAVWSRRSRQSEVLVDDRRGAHPRYQQPPGEYRDPPAY